jgi:hypothetical protein
MELRNRATGAVVTEQQFRSDNPNTSFPQVLTPEIINDFGYDPVLEGPQAVTVPPYQTSVRDGVVEVNDQWFTHYIAIEPDAEGKAAMDAEQATAVRADRNTRLAACDWTQLSDAPLDLDGKSYWALYRETLRMIPQQSGFPWDVQWPPEPTT